MGHGRGAETEKWGYSLMTTSILPGHLASAPKRTLRVPMEIAVSLFISRPNSGHFVRRSASYNGVGLPSSGESPGESFNCG